MIRPIGVDHLDLRFGRVAPLFLKIVADEGEVLHAHRKAVLAVVRGDLLPAHADKALHVRDVVRLHLRAGERLRLFEGDLGALDGVDEVLFDALELLVRHSLDRDDAGALDERARLLGQKLDALGGAVRALVVLPVQKGDGKDLVSLADGQLFPPDVIDGRLGKDVDDRPLQLFRRQAFRVVANNFAQIFHGDAELRREVAADLLGL